MTITLIDRRRSYVDYGLALYRESQLPVAVLARYLSVSPISLWFDLQYHDTEKIYCAQGTTEERESAITLVRQANTYVVDPLTAIQMAHLDIIGDVQKTPGQLVLTKSSIDLLEKLINDERLFGDQDSMALAKEGDDYIRYEDSTEEMQQRIVFFENLKETLSRSFQVVPAIRRPPDSSEILQFCSKMDQSFIDTLYVAAMDGYVLLSDDIGLRGIAKLGWETESTWMQPVLIELRDQGILTQERYADVIYPQIPG